MAFVITRINVGDYDTWKKMFDQDAPGARTASKGYRLYRNAEQPNEVFIQVEFASVDDAKVARDRLVASGVLDRFTDKSGPTVVDEAEAVKN
jgi:hypothetical protein